MTQLDTDVVVIGGGTMGSMITWKLSSRGYKVTCLEANGIAHSRSAVAGDSRLFRRSYRGSTDLSKILSTAEVQWNNLNRLAGEEVFANCGGLYIGESDGGYLRELVECCNRDRLDFELLSADEVRQRFPQHRIRDDESGLFEPTAGFLRTERAVHAAFDLARANGATVLQKAPVSAIHEDSTQVTVTHTHGTITADTAVIAAGTGSPQLLPRGLRESLEIHREILTWFPLLRPAAFNSANFPIFVHIDGDYSAYGAPSLDGSTFKSTLDNRSRPLEEFPDYKYELTPDEISESEITVARFFNDVHPEVSRQECLADLFTTDRQAIVGKVPGKSRTFVATGFSGAGFKMSAGVGELLAQTIADENDSLPSCWDPSRFA